MKFLNRIGFKTSTVLRGIRDGTLTLQELKDKHGVTDMALSRWLGNRFAWVNFRQVVRQVDQRGWLEIKMAAKVACAKLSHSMQSGARMPLWELLLCRTVIELAHTLSRRPDGRARARGRKPPPPLRGEPDLCHPSMKEREKELIAILEEGQEKRAR